MQPQPAPRSIPGLTALALILGLAGLGFSLAGVWLLAARAGGMGAAALAAGLVSAAAAAGLYRRRRWGVILFGLLVAAGSINHLASTLYTHSDLSQASAGQVLAALFSLFVAVLIPFGLIYLVLFYWKQLR